MHITMKISEHTEIVYRLKNIEKATVNMEKMLQHIKGSLLTDEAVAYLDKLADGIAAECAEVELMMD